MIREGSHDKTAVGTDDEGNQIFFDVEHMTASLVSYRLMKALDVGGHSLVGSDGQGRTYETPREFWVEEWFHLDSVEGTDRWWYGSALDYWNDKSTCPATVNGMLGGFEAIAELDLNASRIFLEDVVFQQQETNKDTTTFRLGSCCECGAGIGRVTKGLLLPFGFQRSDLVEVSPRLIEAAPEYLGDDMASKCRFFCVGLQDFIPKEKSYDLVWIQWCLCYLTDVDAVKFLHRCGKAADGGLIILKENTCEEGEAFVVDKDDASVTRSLPYLINLAHQAWLNVVTTRYQDDFPGDLYPVHMIALQLGVRRHER